MSSAQKLAKEAEAEKPRRARRIEAPSEPPELSDVKKSHRERSKSPVSRRDAPPPPPLPTEQETGEIAVPKEKKSSKREKVKEPAEPSPSKAKSAAVKSDRQADKPESKLKSKARDVMLAERVFGIKPGRDTEAAGGDQGASKTRSARSREKEDPISASMAAKAAEEKAERRARRDNETVAEREERHRRRAEERTLALSGQPVEYKERERDKGKSKEKEKEKSSSKSKDRSSSSRDKDKDRDKDRRLKSSRDNGKVSRRGEGEDDDDDDGGDNVQLDEFDFAREKAQDKDKARSAHGRKHEHRSSVSSVSDVTAKAGRVAIDSFRLLTSSIGGAVSRQVEALSAGRFAEWHRSELVLLLVRHGIELRNESGIAFSTLQDMAEDYFQSEEYTPEKPKTLNWFDLITLNSAVRKIQDLFVERRFQRRMMDRDMEGQDAEAGYNEVDEFDDLEMGNKRERRESTEIMMRSESDNAYQSSKVGDAMSMTSIYGSRSDNQNFSMINHSMQDAQSHHAERQRPLHLVSSLLNLPWEGPDWDKAKVHADYYKPRRGGKGGHPFLFGNTTTGRHCCLSGIGEQCDIFREKQTSEFGIYGSGVSNYFKFIKWCAGTMFCLGLVSLPILLANLFGTKQEKAAGSTILTQASLGNLMRSRQSVESFVVRIPFCTQYTDVLFLGDMSSSDGSHDHCYMDSEHLGLYYCYFDLAVCVVAFVAYLWLKYFEENEALTLEKNTVFASMYTIQLKNLPMEANEESLKSYVQEILGKTEKSKVCAVNISYDNLQEIKDCMERGQNIRLKMRLTNQHRYQVTQLRKGNTSMIEGSEESKRIESKVNTLRAEFMKEVSKIDTVIGAREHALANLSTRVEKPLSAFVTFNTVVGVEHAYDKFKALSYYEWFKNSFVDPLPLYMGKRMKIKLAPEPSTILWENLPYSKIQGFCRRLLTSLVALILICFSVACTFVAKYFHDTSSSTQQSSGKCPPGWEAFSYEDKASRIIADTSLTHCYCAPLSFSDKQDDILCKEYFIQTIKTQLVTYAASGFVLGINLGLGNLLQKFARFEKHHSMDARSLNLFKRLFILKYVNTSVVFLLNNNERVLSVFSSLGYAGYATKEFTSEWYETLGTAIMVVQIGGIFTAHAMKFIQYTMYKRNLHKAKVSPLFAATQGELNKLHVGPDFRFAENYAQYMSTFFVCMTFSLGMPLLNWVAFINFLLAYVVDKSFFINIAASPARLNFKLTRAVRALVPWAIVLHMCMSIWTMTNSDVFAAPYSSLQGSSSSVIFDPINYTIKRVHQSIYEKDTYPIALLLLLGLFMRVCFLIVVRVKKSGTCVYVGMCGQTDMQKKQRLSDLPLKPGEATEIEALKESRWRIRGILKSLVSHLDHSIAPKDSIARAVSYPRAVQRNLIKGLATYNILHNPYYKELFAISWKFAMTHHRVRSVYLSDRQKEASFSDLHINDHEAEADARKVEKLRRASAIPSLLLQSLGPKTSKQKMQMTVGKIKAQNAVRDIFNAPDDDDSATNNHELRV